MKILVVDDDSKLSPLSGPFARTPRGHEQIVNKNKRGIEKSILLKLNKWTETFQTKSHQIFKNIIK